MINIKGCSGGLPGALQRAANLKSLKRAALLEIFTEGCLLKISTEGSRLKTSTEVSPPQSLERAAQPRPKVSTEGNAPQNLYGGHLHRKGGKVSLHPGCDGEGPCCRVHACAVLHVHYLLHHHFHLHTPNYVDNLLHPHFHLDVSEYIFTSFTTTFPAHTKSCSLPRSS